jgi:hypothetical protein
MLQMIRDAGPGSQILVDWTILSCKILSTIPTTIPQYHPEV